MRKALYLSLLVVVFAACQNDTPKVETSQPENTKNEVSKASIKVIDTHFSKGRLSLEHDINLEDVENFHGHLCDGLVVGFLSLKEGLKILYPDGIVDRTNTRIVSKASPCLTDIAVYLTGGRYQFNSFYVSSDIKELFIVQRMDNGKTVAVSMNKGVKPVESSKLGKLAVQLELDGCQLDHLKRLEDDFSKFLLKTPPSELFTITELNDFEWNPVLQNDYIKTDILNKNKPICTQRNDKKITKQ